MNTRALGDCAHYRKTLDIIIKIPAVKLKPVGVRYIGSFPTVIGSKFDVVDS